MREFGLAVADAISGARQTLDMIERQSDAAANIRRPARAGVEAVVAAGHAGPVRRMCVARGKRRSPTEAEARDVIAKIGHLGLYTPARVVVDLTRGCGSAGRSCRKLRVLKEHGTSLLSNVRIAGHCLVVDGTRSD